MPSTGTEASRRTPPLTSAPPPSLSSSSSSSSPPSGSTKNSPTTSSQQTSPESDRGGHQGGAINNVDDIWGSAPPSPTLDHARRTEGAQELLPSDLPALRRAHLTDGYRAGIDAGKSNPETAQEGFDAGYAVGAELGARIGWILGVLHELERFNISAAVATPPIPPAMDQQASPNGLKEAQRQLQLEVVVSEMQHLGLLTTNEEHHTTSSAPTGTPPSIQRWTRTLAELARVLHVDLEYRAIGQTLAQTATNHEEIDRDAAVNV